MMEEAEVVNEPDERNKAWGEIDKAVTEVAPSIPWLWDTQPLLRAKDVNGVVNQANAAWDLTWTSIQ